MAWSATFVAASEISSSSRFLVGVPSPRLYQLKPLSVLALINLFFFPGCIVYYQLHQVPQNSLNLRFEQDHHLGEMQGK